ncbi:hypothetical protein ATE68_01395 [Sphingopyxis sp. H038]|uniref:hypothetical protein n=1 Tax=unclassified Sphingopyxis TaxID=2614943 RepID=UPI00073725BE|nr:MULTISPECIES: hypothetical protein [unclassified Sphingopyxis]KTE04333.1 hypothetical protein ATE78_01395 [Sphingopyxis sp. H012]KTE25673.1 hypothetical protein ATE75_16345 [Sphingopyxis sp. H080]KTE36823.1 hypothetical protein ATE68_01395 [Sphingopyxis sp. H038]KTE70030.1 hypothetical protein ATE74_06615 [Sphingopyxis sp. H085]
MKDLNRTVSLDVDSQLSIIDINTFAQSSQSASDTSGSFSMPLPAGDIITQVKGDFSRKKNKMAAIQRSRTLMIDRSEILQYRLVEGDPTKAALAKTCLDGNSTELFDTLKKVPNTDDRFQLELKWVPAGGASKREIYLTGPIIFSNAEPLTNSCDPAKSDLRIVGGLINNWNWWFRKPLGTCEITFRRLKRSQPIIIDVPNEHKARTITYPAEIDYRWERRSVRWDDTAKKFTFAGNGFLQFERSRREEGRYNPRVPKPNAGLPRPLESADALIMQDEMREQGWVLDDNAVMPEKPAVTNGQNGDCKIETFTVEPYRIRWSGTGHPHRGDVPLVCMIKAEIHVVRLVPVTS